MGWLTTCESESSTAECKPVKRTKKCSDWKTIKERVKFCRDVWVKGNFRVDNEAKVGCLSVDKSARVCGNLEVGDSTTLNGPTRVNNHLKVKCNAVVGKDLGVKGSAVICRDLCVKEDVNVGGNLRVKGGVYLSIVKVTEDSYDVQPCDHTVLVCACAEIQLPEPSCSNLGQVVVIKNLNSGCCVTVNGDLFHAPSRVLAPFSGIVLQNDGETWHVLSDIQGAF